jgi:ribosomal protein S18 acetylase RimI-like enzyme
MNISEFTDFSSSEELRELIAEYMRTLPFDISYQSPDSELENLASAYSNETGGALFTARDNGKMVGCVALKAIVHMNSREGIRCCEMKRLYVKEEFRGRNLGQQLANAIVQKAKELNYHFMYLDTNREAQKAAISMYKKMGFTECENYHRNPGQLLCMVLSLQH